MSAALFAEVKLLKHKVACLETVVKELIDAKYPAHTFENAKAKAILTLPIKKPQAA